MNTNGEILSQTSLKEYYVNLHKLYHNALNMLQGINQSLNTNAQNINVVLLNEDNTTDTVTIPSFLYLESRIEELYHNFNSIANLHKSGEGWLNNDGNSFKINVVQSNTAPNSPSVLNTLDLKASFQDNILLNDFISPKTTLRLNVANIANNIHEMVVKKIIIYSEDIYNSLLSQNPKTYEDYKSLLYNYSIDDADKQLYKEYDISLNIPYKSDKYISEFKIIDIPLHSDNTSNPSYYDDEARRLAYDIILDTLDYKEKNAPEKTYALKKGDFLTLTNNYGIYEVTNIYEETVGLKIQYHVTLHEYVGHNYLQRTSENTNMVFKLYKQKDYNEPLYIDIPIEDNQFMILFVASVYNNVKSDYSEGIPVNLNNVYMANYESQELLDSHISYMEYYNKYCMNLGSIINNISMLMFPGPKDLTINDLKSLQTDPDLISLINTTTNFGDLTITNIRKLSSDTDNTYNSLQTVVQEKNNDKNLLSTAISDLQTVLQNITEAQSSNNKQTYDDLIIKRNEIQSNIQKYHQNISNSSDTINKIKLNIYTKIPEYHIRGIINTEYIEEFLRENYPRVNLVGIDVEYKYRLIGDNLETENVESINGSLFSNWIKMPSFDRTKVIKIDDYNNLSVELDETINTDANIKWNQIDIPIKEDDIVIMRLRYKYSIGQPFIDFYSPWTNEYSKSWEDAQVTNINDIQEIIKQNDEDLIVYNMLNKLDSYGYTTHINNKISDTSNNVEYYHSADKIYSGFKTDDQYLSVKDKIVQLETALAKYDSMLSTYVSTTYEIKLSYKNTDYTLYPNSFKVITIPITKSISDVSIKETLDIVIKNTGDGVLKLYSLFCGSNVNALYADTSSVITPIGIYDDLARYNYYIDNKVFSKNPEMTDIFTQTYNQYLYFRNNNPFNMPKEHENNLNHFLDSSVLLNDYNDDLKVNIYPSQEMSDNIKIDEMGWDTVTNLSYKQVMPTNSLTLGLILDYKPTNVYNTGNEYKFYFDIKTNTSSMRDVLHYGFILKFEQLTETEE